MLAVRGGLAVTFVCVLVAVGAARGAGEPLPSWNDGPAKKAIVAFVDRVTKEGGPDFVPVAERIAVFDNDGTLWCEQPIYFQFQFGIDRVKALVGKHPEWKEKAFFKAVLAEDIKEILAGGWHGLEELMAIGHAGMTPTDFEQIVRDWLKIARHPRFKRPYTDLAYQPMLELLAYLRGKGFKTHIVSGGGIEFMRSWTQRVYGIPPEQVVGTTTKLRYETREGRPVLVRLVDFNFIDDGAGKPTGISQFIGRRPIMAFGNSDGDYEMLRWTTAGSGPRFGLIVHHDDAEREYAYDRKSLVGRLEKALDEAPKRGWTVVSMKRDFKVMFAFEKK